MKKIGLKNKEKTLKEEEKTLKDDGPRTF